MDCLDLCAGVRGAKLPDPLLLLLPVVLPLHVLCPPHRRARPQAAPPPCAACAWDHLPLRQPSRPGVQQELLRGVLQGGRPRSGGRVLRPTQDRRSVTGVDLVLLLLVPDSTQLVCCVLCYAAVRVLWSTGGSC